MKIGFIGLGIMGKPMAKNLIKAGYKLVVYNRTKEKEKELLELGAESAQNPKEIAEKSDIIITMLPDNPDVEEVILGENGVIEGLKQNQIVIDMSSIVPLTTKKIEKEVAIKHAHMLDAPVSGGEPKAISGDLAIMVGGKKEIFNQCLDILKSMGKSVVHVGNIGAGQTVKLANQIIVALNIEAMSEALVFATKAGADPELLYNAIRAGLAGSNVLDAKTPMILKRDFEPGFKVKLHKKDLKNVLETANELNVELPATKLVEKMLDELIKDGKEELDHAAILHYLEKINKIEVKKN